jgi:hypothetical protein
MSILDVVSGDQGARGRGAQGLGNLDLQQVIQ